MVHGLNQQGALVSFFARSALKSKKRFGGGVLEPSHYVEALIRQTGSSDKKMANIEEASLLDGFEGIRSSYDKLDAAMFILNVVRRTSQEGEVHGSDLFDLTGNALKVLESESDLIKFRIHFIIRYLKMQGVLERLDWMNPFLAHPMSRGNLIPSINVPQIEKLKLESALENYLAHAEA